MHIITDMFLPFGAGIELIISMKDGALNVPVKITRIISEGCPHDALGIEVINPSREYLEFVESLSPKK